MIDDTNLVFFCEDHFEVSSNNTLLQITILVTDLFIKFSTYYKSDTGYFRLS